MSEKIVRFLVIMSMVMGMALYAGCSAGRIQLSGSDNGSTRTLSPGDIVAITLESNPTTGYSWQVIQMEASVLQLVGEPEFTTGSGTDGLVGAPGTETFTFRAAGTGQTTLVLGYLRPWEDAVTPEKTYTIHFLIE